MQALLFVTLKWFLVVSALFIASMHFDHVIVEQSHIDIKLDFQIFHFEVGRVAMLAEKMEGHGANYDLCILVGWIREYSNELKYIAHVIQLIK